MTILILLAIVWVVVLGSQLWKRRKERMSSHSVWAFKRQLKTLRRKHAELAPIDGFRHNPASEASYFSAFQSTNVVTGDASWASREKVSLVRVVGSQAVRATGRVESDYSVSNGFTGYDGETENNDYAYSSPASTYSTPAPVVEVGSSVSSSSRNGSDPHMDDDSLYEASPPRSDRSYGSNKSYNEDSMHDGHSHTRNQHVSASTALRRRRTLVGLIGSAVVFFLFGLIPALGFMMILSVLGVAAAVTYIVLLARLNATRVRVTRVHATRMNTTRMHHSTMAHVANGRISGMSTRRPAHARHLIASNEDGDDARHDPDRYALPAGSSIYGDDPVFNGRYTALSEPLPIRRVSGTR